MRLLVLDTEGEGTGVDLALRAHNAGHEVNYWVPNSKAGNPRPYGDGLLTKPKSWEPFISKADLIVATGNNKYEAEFAEYFSKGYPLFVTNAKSAELELDRGKGQEVLKKYGVDTIPYKVVHSVDEAVAHVVKTGVGYALKPWGGDSNSAMTHVAKDANEAIFTLERWKREKLFKGDLMMQELCEGVEMGISCFFGPNGFSSVIEESFEHKKFLTGDLGENTGEMGTVIRHVEKSKLFKLVLAPLDSYLHMCKYIGDVSVNCIICKDGSIRPLEFTMRLGWPDFCIRHEVIRGDPVRWMFDLLQGKDTLQVSSKVAAGVVMVHGDFPKCKDMTGTWAGYPIEGVSDELEKHVHWQQVMDGEVSRLMGKSVRRIRMMLTAGVYPLVVTGSATTVSQAVKNAYSGVELIDFPSNKMYRLDIGKRLKKDLPELQKHGFATGMVY